MGRWFKSHSLLLSHCALGQDNEPQVAHSEVSGDTCGRVSEWVNVKCFGVLVKRSTGHSPLCRFVHLEPVSLKSMMKNKVLNMRESLDF